MFNARSVVNKVPELHQLLYCDQYSLFCVTETWLHSDVSCGLLDPQSEYSIIRRDRTGSSHGGVAAFIKRNLYFVEISVDTVYDSLELLCFDIYFFKCKMRFFVIYGPPYYDQSAIDYMDLLITCPKQYYSTDRGTVNVILGDLNCPKSDWINLCSSSDHISKSLLNWFSAHECCQFVQFPTCGDNILDLVLADDNQIISCIYSNPPLGHSDYCIVSFVVDIEVTHSSNE